jgi:hypothetical protein
MIGSSNNENLDSIQRYFNEHKPSVLTSDEKIITPQESVEPIKIEEVKNEKLEGL